MKKSELPEDYCAEDNHLWMQATDKPNILIYFTCGKKMELEK